MMKFLTLRSLHLRGRKMFPAKPAKPAKFAKKKKQHKLGHHSF